jgi:transcriptional regulator of arginine metabolism
MKRLRQTAILDLVERERVHSQERLRERLAARGFSVTQATLSRDIKELGLVKRSADGTYQRPNGTVSPTPAAESTLRRSAREFLRSWEQVQNLLVLKTDPGRAQILAIDIDQALLEGVAGTIGGDDTILVVARDADQARRVADRLAEWAAPLTPAALGARRGR